MPQPVSETAMLTCERCGYDLRAHADDGRCSECGWLVSDSKQYAAISRRPAWRDSDPRWRRRVLAGLGCLLVVFVMHLFFAFGWETHLPALSISSYRGTVVSLEHSMLMDAWFFMPVGICCGLVLMFAKESNRRRSRLDWTKRWGVFCCYVVFFLSAVNLLFGCALVTIGLAGLFHSMPPAYQPVFTPWLSKIGGTYLRYGPHFGDGANVTLVAFSAVAVLLACVQWCEALWSIVPRWLAGIVVLPMVATSLLVLLAVEAYVMGYRRYLSEDVREYAIFFRPELLTNRFLTPFLYFPRSDDTVFWITVEAIKWGMIVIMALVLGIAQLMAYGLTKKSDGSPS